jgi:pimeloyl-ACP methyl ester carboxylesterase
MRPEPADPYPRPPTGVPFPPSPDPGRVRVTAVGEHSVHWLEYGDGPECLALVHGLSGSTRWWSRNVQALSRRYRLLVPDVIGFGRSRIAGAIPAVPELAAVLAGWMAEAADGAPAHLVGHSMGGQLAIHVAARYPERIRRLVLVDAAGLPRPLNPRFLMRFAYDVLPPRRWGDPRFLPVIVADALTAGPRVLLRALLHVLRDDVTPLLPRIAAPTLVVWGAGDALVPHAHGRRMRRTIPDARLLVLPDACHNPMVDRPDAFNRAVLDFLAGDDVGT